MLRQRSISSMNVTKISKMEKESYEDFARGYQENWSNFVDPIAFRILRKLDGSFKHIDGRMIPLIDGTEYNELHQHMGNVRLPDSRLLPSGLRVMMAISNESQVKKMLNTGAKSFLGSGISWLGNYWLAGVLDRNVLWDGLMFEKHKRDFKRFGVTKHQMEKELMQKLPIYAGFEVGDPLVLASTLITLKTMASQVAPGLISWNADTPYRESGITKIASLQDRGEFANLALYYTTVDGIFIATLNRITMEIIIDSLKDKKDIKTELEIDKNLPQWTKVEPQAVLSLRPRENNSMITKAASLFVEAVLKHSNNASLVDVTLLDDAFDSIDQGRVAIDGLAFLGFEPRLVHKGKFLKDQNGTIKHSIYGDLSQIKEEELPFKDVPLSKVFDALKFLEFSIGFDGIVSKKNPAVDHRGLHVSIEWREK